MAPIISAEPEVPFPPPGLPFPAPSV
jgi:hypothetical protein